MGFKEFFNVFLNIFRSAGKTSDDGKTLQKNHYPCGDIVNKTDYQQSSIIDAVETVPVTDTPENNDSGDVLVTDVNTDLTGSGLYYNTSDETVRMSGNAISWELNNMDFEKAGLPMDNTYRFVPRKDISSILITGIDVKNKDMESPDMITYINREISWLSFNERVLQEASDHSVPLLERLKFLGIFSSNLDEFFSVRVGTVQRMLDADVKSKALVGGSPKKTMKAIHAIVLNLRDKFDFIFRGIVAELQEANIFIINENELKEGHEQFLKEYFEHKVRPRLVPIMLNEGAKFPYLKNQAIYLAITMSGGISSEDRYALIEVPVDVLPRYIVLPEVDSKKYVILLDDVIRFGLYEIFSIFDYTSFNAYTIKLTRDAELDIDDDVTKSFFEKVSKSLKEREKGQPVRFVYDRKIPVVLLNFILDKLDLRGFENLVPGGRYHNARDFMNFPDIGSPSMVYEKQQPILHPELAGHKNIMNLVREKDILLHYPYHSFDSFIDLLREASIDPNVTQIKMTLYRVARNSNVINALINAIKNGKNVTVVIELQARFDEASNIFWTKRLEEEGARIIDGVPGLKVHSKLCLIRRLEDGDHVDYVSVGTGNFNESTARIYSDHILLTSDKRITKEVSNVFEFLEINYKYFKYDHLVVSPHYMRDKFTRLIKNEINNAKEGKPAYLHAKMNSLVDLDMIKLLYEASNAGVEIKMVIRGICSLVPGIKGLSDNIDIISIVDKYLEHSRIFIFCNGGDELIYLSSADWMVRNLDRRVEVAVPLYDPGIKEEIKAFMELQFRDNTRARIIDEQQRNSYNSRGGRGEYRAQDDIYEMLKNRAHGVQ